MSLSFCQCSRLDISDGTVCTSYDWDQREGGALRIKIKDNRMHFYLNEGVTTGQFTSENQSTVNFCKFDNFR